MYACMNVIPKIMDLTRLAWAQVCMYVCMHACMCSGALYAPTVHIYIYIYIYAYIHTYIHTYTNQVTRQPVLDQTKRHVHTYTHTYIHTYIHTYTNQVTRQPIMDETKHIVRNLSLGLRKAADGYNKTKGHETAVGEKRRVWVAGPTLGNAWEEIETPVSGLYVRVYVCMCDVRREAPRVGCRTYAWQCMGRN